MQGSTLAATRPGDYQGLGLCPYSFEFGWKSTPCQNLIVLIESIKNLCSNVLHAIGGE